MSLFIEQMSDETLLREAWHRVQRGGRSGGVDGMTVDMFRARAEARLQDLGRRLRTGTYRPSPVMRVDIPKASGGRRLLGIPTVVDRIAQTAAALVLHERVAVSFSDRSFAYRPFLGPRRAAFFLKTLIPGAEWAVTADIASFFDNVDHRILASQLRGAGVDEPGERLVLGWLRVPVHARGGRLQPVKGLPQGSPIAPVLANLYLTPFDTALEAEGFPHVRYADDFVVLAPARESAERALRFVTTYLSSRMKLEIKPAKTQVTSLGEGFDFVGFHFKAHEWIAHAGGVGRFKERVTEITGDSKSSLPDACRAHNDLVIGWRNYYGGLTPEMDRQLAEVDAWRAGQCRALLARHGDDAGIGALWFESLLGRPATAAAPAGYDNSTVDVDAAPDTADEWHRLAEDEGHDRRMFSTSRALRAAEIGSRQAPTLSPGGWLTVPTYGAFLSKSHALIVVRRKKQIIFECAFDEVTGISIESDGAVVSTTLMAECARRGLTVTMSRTSGRPFARLASARSRADAAVLRVQLRTSLGRSGLPIVRALLEAKLANQRALLLYHRKYQGRPSAVRARLTEAATAIAANAAGIQALGTRPLRKARQTLFLLEARAAAHYWHAFGVLVPARFGFRGRAHRDATDVINRSLNYGYGFLLNRVWLAVHHAGLEPSLGLLHTGRRRTPGLVFDLMEPFRQPVVDRTVLSLVGRRARLSLNADGELSLRTRALLRRAFHHRLSTARAGGRPALDAEIRRQAILFRHAAERRRPMTAYRMTW